MAMDETAFLYILFKAISFERGYLLTPPETAPVLSGRNEQSILRLCWTFSQRAGSMSVIEASQFSPMSRNEPCRIRSVPHTLLGVLTSSKFRSALIFITLTVVFGLLFPRHPSSRSLFVTVKGNGRVSSKPSGINCPSTCAAEFNFGTSVALYESTSGSFNGWSQACSGTGSCSVTMSTVQFVTAVFDTGSHGSTTGVWTVENQQPVTQQFYPGSIFTTPLPADAGSHLYPNSDAIVNNMFGGDSNGSGATSSITSTLPSNGGHNSQKGGFYYASQSDPLFKIVSVSAPPANSQYSPLGLYFHMTSGATWDSDFGDENLVVWDQSTDIDSTPGGRIITSYFYNGGTYQVRSLPTNCTATTPAQADAQPQCQLSWYYTSFDYPFNQLTPWNTDDSWSSMNDSNGARYVRLEEIMQNTINHAIPLNYQCGKSSSGNGIADGYVFPAYGAAAGCKFVDNLRPLDGNWFYIDSGYNCGSLPLWQQPICTAMQTYGGYIADTGGDGNGLYVRPLEGGMAASTAGVNSRFFNSLNTGTPAWIITNGGLSCPGGGYPKTCTGSNGLAVVEDSATVAEKVVLKFFNMPGVLSHIHIIDPCVAKRLAGKPGAC